MHDSKPYRFEQTSSLPFFLIFGVIAYAAFPFVKQSITQQAEQAAAKQSRVALADQLREIKAGKTNALVHPAPQFIEDVFADAECAAKIRDVYLGGDVSDPRLAKLAELPNLKCVILFGAGNVDAFIEGIRDSKNIEELCLDWSVMKTGFACLKSLPNLRSLAFQVNCNTQEELDGLKNLQSLERLTISRLWQSDKPISILPILQSYPRLRELTIGAECRERDFEEYKRSIISALPNCKCRFLDEGQ